MPLQNCGEGGYKWGESGVCFTGVGAKEKALAVGKAIKTADAGIITDALATFKATIDTTTGFLTAPVKLARTGVQEYFGFELGLLDRALEKIGVFRDATEVFHPDSIKSFMNLVVTDDHPSELVNTGNVKKLQVGTVSNVQQDENTLSGVVTITDKDQIAKAKDGKIEVSVGYGHELKPLSGIHDGVKYEFVQTNIRANHLAIVDAGRCGPDCKLTLDDKKELIVKIITIDGIDYKVEDEQLAQAILNQKKTSDAKFEEVEKEKDQAEEEKEKMKKEKDKEEAAKDAALKSVLDSATLNTLISERAVLISDAKAILGKDMLECNDCPKEIKVAVIDKVLGLGDLSKKSNDYIDAAYDMAIVGAKKATGTLDNLGDDFKNKKKETTDTRETARSKYMKDQLGMEEN